MKASFTLIPAESRRLIAKAVSQMEEIKIAQKKAYIVITEGRQTDTSPRNWPGRMSNRRNSRQVRFPIGCCA